MKFDKFNIIKNIITQNILLFLLFLSFVPLSGCQQRGLADYSSPEATYNTYRDQVQTLRVVADHRHYRRAIRCFTKDDWKWFEKNYDKIKIEKEKHVYDNLYKSKKLAYVFGRSVALKGPSPDEEDFTFEKKSEDKVILRVKGYPEEIVFIKTKSGWQISGLFGIKKD
jgi:hypothetical protein